MPTGGVAATATLVILGHLGPSALHVSLDELYIGVIGSVGIRLSKNALQVYRIVFSMLLIRCQLNMERNIRLTL